MAPPERRFSLKLWQFACALLPLASLASPATAQSRADEVQPAAHVAAARDSDDGRVRLVRQLIRTRKHDAALAAQLLQLTADMTPADGASVFDELATAQLQYGDLNGAGTTLRTIIDRYPGDPAALAAVRRLANLYASAEAARSQEPQAVGKVVATPGDAAAAQQGEANNRRYREFLEYAIGAANHSIAQHKEWAQDPALALATFTAGRKLAGAGPKSALRLLKGRAAGDPWGDAARMEEWLAESSPGGAAPKMVVRCPSGEPPALDGKLDDACWQKAGQASLDPAAASVGQPSDLVQWAHDGEYLYVAFRVLKRTAPNRPEKAVASLPGAPRMYDSADRQRDHVRLLVDVDRDYATAYELTVDDRGHTADAACGATSWNPEWFVAAASDASGWCFEAAIPWTSLVAAPPAAGASWAIAVERDPSPAPLTPASFVVLQFE